MKLLVQGHERARLIKAEKPILVSLSNSFYDRQQLSATMKLCEDGWMRCCWEEVLSGELVTAIELPTPQSVETQPSEDVAANNEDLRLSVVTLQGIK